MDELLAAVRAPVLLLALLGAGVQAGTWAAWATGVMPGLARVDDRTFVHTMQQVNVAILNPVFLTGFVGAPALAVLATLVTPGPARWWAAAGAVLAVAAVVVTAARNVPLNDALAGLELEAADGVDLGRARAAFEAPWVRWNLARLAASTGSLLCMGGAALVS